MDERTKELVALGAAVASACHHCIDQYIARCDELEVSRQDVMDAVEIGLSVRQDAQGDMEKHAEEVLGHYPQEAA